MRTLEPGCFEVLTRSGSRCLVRAKWPVWFDCEEIRLAQFQPACSRTGTEAEITSNAQTAPRCRS
jgi:hypothetical protein